MPSILNRASGLFNAGRSFLGSKIAAAGNKIRGGVYQLGNKVFGGGVGKGKQLFTTAANYAVDAALNGANYYGKKFANSDFIRRHAGMVVPEMEKSADYFTKKLRDGYYGYGADTGDRGSNQDSQGVDLSMKNEAAVANGGDSIMKGR